jgi:dTMP kinase
MSDRRAPFIVLDGPDGSGKSGQLRLLAETLRAEGVGVVQTREPGGSPSAEVIRRLLVQGDAPDWSPIAEVLLFNAARVQHLLETVRPALADGKAVLCDRYVSSTLAYQVGGGGVDAATVLELHRLCCGDFWPDLTVIVDVPVEVGLARARAREDGTGGGETRFEAKGLDYHRRLRRGYLDLAARRADFLVIDGDRPFEAVSRDVAAAARAALARFPSA